MKRQTQNPYLPGWEYVPDGEPKLFDKRVYVYGSHDEARGKTCCTGDYVCWSAPEDDLASWTFEGVIFRKSDDPDYDDKVLLFAPDVAQGPDGRFYLYYFSMRMEKIGVAVCETPAGHYRYLGDVRFEDGKVLSPECGYGLPFDPAILSEAEGNWLYYGFAMQKHVEGLPEAAYMGGYVARLSDDMLTICGTPVPTIPGRLQADGTAYEGHAFLEASSIRHYKDKYYLVYSSELGHELCYAVNDRPDGRIAQVEITSSGADGKPWKAEGEYSALKYLAFEGQERQIAIRVRGDFDGTVCALLDHPDGEKMAEITVGPEKIWNWRSSVLMQVQGVHKLYFRLKDNGVCDIDCFRIDR